MSIARFNKWQDTSGNMMNTVVQVVTVTDTTRTSVYSDNLAAIPNLSISITPKYATSKILLLAMLNTNGQHVTSYGILRNGATLGGSANSNVAGGAIATTYYGSDVGSNMYNQFIQYLDTAGTTSAITYAAALSASWAGTPRTIYINDRDTSDMKCSSTLTALEILQ